MTPTVPEPLVRACALRLRATLLDPRRQQVLQVQLGGAEEAALTLHAHLPRGGVLPPDGALVRLRLVDGSAIWSLATHVSGQSPFTLRLPGVLTREHQRHERAPGERIGRAWLDGGGGAVPAEIKALSAAGATVTVPLVARLSVGRLGSFRLCSDVGELRCLARVRQAIVVGDSHRVVLEFGELTAEASGVLGRLLAVRAGAGAGPEASSPPAPVRRPA